LWWSEIIQEGCNGVEVYRKIVVELTYTGRLWWSRSIQKDREGVKVKRKAVVE
jgi:hypothetical protein